MSATPEPTPDVHGSRPSIRTVLAFDFGLKRIGVAVGQDLTGKARALATVRVRAGKIDWETITGLVETWQPDCFVVGLPRHDDDRVHALTAPIEKFARRLEGRFHKPVSFIDERLSSYAAAQEGEAARAGLDAVAARLILETWFATHSPT